MPSLPNWQANNYNPLRGKAIEDGRCIVEHAGKIVAIVSVLVIVAVLCIVGLGGQKSRESPPVVSSSRLQKDSPKRDNCQTYINYLATEVIPSSDVVPTNYKCEFSAEDGALHIIVNCVHVNAFSGGAVLKSPCKVVYIVGSGGYSDSMGHSVSTDIVDCDHMTEWPAPGRELNYPCEPFNLDVRGR